MRSLLWTVTLSAISTLAAGETKPAQPEMRIYDVTAITALIPDLPGPWVDLPGTSIAPVSPFAPLPAAMVTVQSLGDMIRNRVQPDSWDPNLGTSIEERGGVLVIAQTVAVHGLIGDLLRTFHTEQAKQLNVQGLLIEVTPAQLVPVLGQGGKVFSKPEIKALLEKGKLRAAPQLAAQNTQRAHTRSGTEHAYVSDADISGDMPDPVVKTCLEGIVFDVRTTLSHDYTMGHVELRLSIQDKVNIRELDGMKTNIPDIKDKPPALTSSENPAAVKPTELQAHFPLQSAAVEARMLRQTMDVHCGEWTLAGILPPAKGVNADAPQHMLVFIQVNKVE